MKNLNELRSAISDYLSKVDGSKFSIEKDFENDLVNHLKKDFDVETQLSTQKLDESRQKLFSAEGTKVPDLVVRVQEGFVPIELKYERNPAVYELDEDKLNMYINNFSDVTVAWAIFLDKTQHNDYYTDDWVDIKDSKFHYLWRKNKTRLANARCDLKLEEVWNKRKGIDYTPKPQGKRLGLILLLSLLLTGIGQMWATTIYYRNTNSWANVYIHYWGGTGGTTWGSLPKMTRLSGTSDIWYCNIGNNTSCLFASSSGGANKTSDQTGLGSKDGQLYDNGNWLSTFVSSGFTWYFDTRNVTSWTNPYFRVGHGSYNSAYAMSNVAGTKYLWSCSSNTWGGFAAYTVANSAGYTNAHTIYQPSDEKPTGGYAITKLLNYQSSNVTSDLYLLAGSSASTGQGATYYNVTAQTSLPSYTVSFSSPTHGTLSIQKYTKTDGSTKSAISSGESVLPTQIVQLSTSSWSTGYELDSYSATNATRISDGLYYITGNASFSASEKEKTYSVTVETANSTMGKVMTNKTSTTVTAKHFTSDCAITAHNEDGYHFVNWTKTGSVVIADATDESTTINATAASATVTANFAPNTISIILDDNGSYLGNGSASITFMDDDLTITSHARRTSWNVAGYWSASGNQQGVQVIDAAGNLIANVSGYTDEDGNWINSNDEVTLYADWSQTYSLDVEAGSGISSVSGSNADVTLNSKYAISATPLSGYTFSSWTASPSDNGVFDDASSASTNVTVKNGNVTVTGAATENMTTVTVNVSPAGAGTLTKGGAAFTPGNSVSVGVTTGYSMVATPNSGYVFHDWTKTGNAAGTPSTNTFPLKGNGSAGTGTLTANFGIASGWYMIGDNFGGWGTSPYPTSDQLTYPYRGMSGVYYIPVASLPTNKYWRVRTGSTQYNTSSSTTDDNTISKGTIYSLSTNTKKASKPSSALSDVWIVVNTGSSKKLWVQDPQAFHNVNVTGADNAKGPVKVTLKTTSAFTKGDNVFETTQYASGETFTVTVTGVSGWIPTITIGGVSTTWWKEQATYTADGTMSSADVAVTISYTPTRAVRFAKTTGCETLTATGPSSTAVEDNTKIKDGTSITFHQENSTGYTFSKWYSNNTGTSGTEYSTDDDDYELTVSSTAYTIYPIYDEDMHDVTVNAQTGGTVSYNGGAASSSCTARAGKVTASANIVATASTGYYFVGWQLPDGTITKASESAYNGSTSTYTIHATEDGKTVTALFNVRYALLGSTDASDAVTAGMPGWGEGNEAPFTYSAGTSTYTKTVDLTVPNVNYKFRIVDRRAYPHLSYGLSSKAVIQADGKYHDLASTSADAQLATAGVGTYTLTVQTNASGYPKVKITNPASQRITMGILTQTDGATSAYTGGTIYAEDELDNEITNGLYIRSGDDITFTATPKAGYIWHGWYDNAACDGGLVTTGRTFTDEDVTSDITRYALFEEALYTVTVHRNDVIETTVKVGVDTHPEITAGAAPTGMIFDRWVTTGSATVADAYASTTTITGATDNVSTVTATFKELPKIYIDLTSATGWHASEMYVVFYKDGGYFDSNNGTGLSSTYVITPTPLEMTRMGTSKIWYYSYDPTSGVFEGETITCVAFVDHTFAANTGNFSSATVTYRTDFSSCMNMFVVTDDTGVNKNSTCYYRNTNAVNSTEANKGYWRKYEENNSGFYLNNLPGGSVEFTNEDGGNSYTAVANLDANTDYYFYLGGCNGWNWSNNNGTYPFNYSNPTRNLETYNNVSEDKYRCKLRTTAAGYYTFTLTPQNTRNLQVSVAFPVAANDYRAVYNNAASSPTVSRPSNIIKNDQNSGTISLWLNKGTNYISFQKAAVAGGGAVSWSACGSQQTVTGVSEAGVYNMTLTRSGDTYIVSTPEAYTGDLYIRTDCAPGQWADYTENRLDENTFNFDPDDDDTYDYYYCKWINDAGTNVRCVIANDINVAISDTLKTEAILGGGETLPEGANVRFSYNSVTNTLKRSYLTGASTDVFLNIIPDAASTVYKTDGTTDMYGSAAAKNKFSDLGNWVYEMEAKVKPGATASVQANYNSTSQALIAAETKLVGGTGSDLYSIRLVYDFRTNYLMSAWMPNGDVSTSISLNSDMMIVRRGQEDANQLSFSGTGELTDVKRAYGVFEFNKSEMVSHMAIWNEDTYKLCMYYFSLPFDVNVADIFGVGTMGDDWRIQFYNGTKRAAKGWFAGDGTTTFWEDVPADTVLHAYEGYCLMLNRSHFNNGSHAVWNNVTTNAYLYFPSAEPVSALANNEMPITVPSHECTIDRFFDQDKAEYYDEETKTWSKGARNHKYVDSHWNLMGTPLFETANATGVAGCTVTIGDADSTLTYIYEWVPSTNSMSARQVLNNTFTFKPMYAYMVQYSGRVTFTGASITPASIAARRTSENKQYTIDLLLTKEDQFAGRTYVELRENAVDSFMLNEDMYMMKGSKIGDIYTHADGYELAANVLSVNSHIVPVSIDAKAAGTYTISMPSNFSGTVTLTDKYAQTRTDLGLEDYEIYLEKGTISDRFELEINISKVPTAIDGVDEGSLKDGKAHKFIMNGVMYILENGRIYDARGNRVK